MLFNWAFLFLISAIPAFGLKNSLLENGFNWFQEEKISDFKLKLRKVFEELSSVKTAMELEHNMVPYISTSRVQTGITKEISKGCTVQVDGAEIVFVVASGNLSELRNATITTILKFPSYRTFLSLQAVVNISVNFLKARTVILLAQISDRTQHFVNIYDYDFKGLKHRRKIPLDGLSLVSATKIGAQFYVVTVPKSSPFPTLKVHQLTGVEYSIISYLQLNASCSTLETWSLGATLYVALSYVDSRRVEILQFREDSGEFLTTQVINVYAFVLKVVQDPDNTYLICGTEESVILYWWTGYRFREMQSKLFRKRIRDVAAHRFLDRIVIAVAFRDEVVFLAQDRSASYVSAGSQTFDPADSLKSVLLWKDSRHLFMMPLFKGKRPLSVFEVDLRFDAPDPQKEHALKKCMDRMELQMTEREKFIEDKNSGLKNLWRPSETRRISNLIVNGSIKSNSSATIQTLILSSNLLSLGRLRERNVYLRDSAKEKEFSISRLVHKSGTQIILGDLRFSKSIFVPKVTVELLLNHTVINKVPSKRLPYALKKKGQQTFPYKTSVFAADATRVTTSMLNKNMIGEYVLLNKGSWNMTGHFTFGNVSAKNIRTHTINGIDVPGIVLRSKTQEISGHKSFKKLSAKSIRTVRQRKRHLDGIKDLVYLDSKQIRPPVKFDSVLRIKGNLTVSLLNRKNVTHQFLNSVRRKDDTDIFGSKVFNSVVVKDTMIVFDGYNDFLTKNLMTVNTDQYITGNVTFSSVATFSKNIKTLSLNGHDLMSEAVKTSDLETEIKGVKIFQEDLKVSNITMDDGIQIDYFDPSEEASKFIFKIPNNNATFSREMTVGNIIANNVIVERKHFPILEELDNVWLKTHEQNITFFTTGKMTVSELNVFNVDGIDVYSFVPVSEDISIDETITFAEKISTKTLKLQKESKVDFPPEFWNPNVKVKIPGNITIQNPAVEGNVTISGMFENFEKGFMNKASMQDVIGPVKFRNIMLNELNGAYLYFDTLNGMNLTEYYDHAVLLSKKQNISRKAFQKLRGTAMICYGTLNNVSLDKIATIHTPQKLTSYYRLHYSMKFKNIILNFLNEMKLENVVLKDTKRSISNKNFIRSITALNVTTDENINGVNLTKLNKEAFSKTGTSKTGARITFLGNVTLEELQVRKNKTIDGVNLANLIMTNETVKLENFKVSVKNASINVENVRIKGLINGCNVSEIIENVLLLKGGAQNITSKVVRINTLEVQGSLSVKYANGANVTEWIIVLNATSESDTDSDVTFEHLIADHVHISDTVNNVSLELLFKDSVRKNYSQAISGMKKFEDIEVTDVNMSSVASSKTCGANLMDVYVNSINKAEGKGIILRSNLKLENLTINNMTINGTLNGLKFPDDVVLSYVSEHIDDEVVIHSNMSAMAGLTVDGKIDGVEMATFLEERVTLNATETISAELVFENDAYISGNTLINGLLNKTRLYDVVNKLQSYTIEGMKTFKEELTLMSNATVSGYVNEILTDHLDKSILKVSRNETSLKGLVNFSSVSLSSLKCVTINGVNIQDFYNNTHRFVHDIRNKLYNFTSNIQKHEDLMRSQKENTEEHPLSLFNSFELHKILNYSFIEKFVPIYEYGSYGPNYDRPVTGMIMWVKINRTRDCRSTLSIISDVSSDGSFDETSREWGKFFLFSLHTEREGVDGFSVQAEYANCTEEHEIRITALNSTHEMKPNTIKPPVNATLLDVHLLEVDDVFLIFSFAKADPSGNHERIFVFQYDASTENWTPHQNLHSQEMTSNSFVYAENEDEGNWFALPSVYLSVTGHEVNHGVTIYKWEDDQFHPITNVSTSASSYSCWVVINKTLYLLLSKENKGIKSENGTRTPVFSETLEVYTLDEELILNHTVEVEGVTSMDVFMLAEETFVLATSHRKGMVYVLQFRGYNGFEVIQEIPSPDATEARVFTVNRHPYVAINSKTVPSKILNATISGFELH